MSTFIGKPTLHVHVTFVYAVASKRRIFFCTRVRFGVQSRSESSKVDDFGTNRMRVYHFLLVGHCDYGPILHRF